VSLPDSHLRLFKRPYSHGELIADGVVHAVAIVAGIIAFAVLFVKVALHGDVDDGLAMAVYAAGFFLLFGFSCAYNMAPPSPVKWILRRFDHSAIYLMISGTYTALMSQMHDHFWAWTLCSIVWAGSLAGVALKLFMPGRFDRVSIAIYLLLGWIAVIAIKPLVAALPAQALILVLIGGMFYSVGVLFHCWHRLKFQNAIWHLFVIIAAGCHYAGIVQPWVASPDFDSLNSSPKSCRTRNSPVGAA
jgi:hemolysin III